MMAPAKKSPLRPAPPLRRAEERRLVHPVLVRNSLDAHPLTTPPRASMILSKRGVVQSASPLAAAAMATDRRALVGSRLDLPLARGARASIEVVRTGEGQVAVTRGQRQRRYKVTTMQILPMEVEIVRTRWHGQNAYRALLHDPFPDHTAT